MWVRNMAFRSETERSRDCNSARKVSKVDAGPGSRIAYWPPDSRRTAPIECGRPIQLRSSTVVESIYGMVREHRVFRQIAKWAIHARARCIEMIILPA